MVNINRQVSREDNPKGEHELAEMKPQPSKPATKDQSSTNKQEVTIEMEQLLKTNKIIKRKRICGKTCRRICKTFYLTMLGLGVLVLGLRAIWTDFIKPKDRVEIPNMVDRTLNVVGYEKLKNEMVPEILQPEEYEIDTEQLYYKKEVHWKGQPGNKQVITETSNKTGCIRSKTSGTLQVFNSISFQFKNQERFYHSINLCRDRCDLVKLSSFSWSQPQSGRQPSTLQFLVQVEVGDELCLKTTNTTLIYAGFYDNSLLVEKVS